MREAETAILNCLKEVPTLDFDSPKGTLAIREKRPDYGLEARKNGGIRPILIEVKTSGEPRYARAAVNQLLIYLQESPDAYGIFCAPYISEKSADICRQANVGYVDLAGNCRIAFDNVFILKEGRPNRFTRESFLRSLFSPKAERVLRVLLTAGPRIWKTADLAGEAEVSFGQVANVKKLLEEQEWIESGTVGFKLISPIELIQEWSKNYSFRRNLVRTYYSMLDPTEFERRCLQVCEEKNLRCALTGFSAAARYAPAVLYRQIMAYLDGDAEIVASALEMRQVDSGANVLVLEPYDAGVFYGMELIDRTALVSPVQTYLDLIQYRGRGEEAAEAVLDQVIRKIW
jgi:hypothetical protein